MERNQRDLAKNVPLANNHAVLLLIETACAVIIGVNSWHLCMSFNCCLIYHCMCYPCMHVLHYVLLTIPFSFTVLTHSSSVGRSGTFCVMSSVLEQLKVEGIVDLFFTIHSLRQQQPGLVQTFVSH